MYATNRRARAGLIIAPLLLGAVAGCSKTDTMGTNTGSTSGAVAPGGSTASTANKMAGSTATTSDVTGPIVLSVVDTPFGKAIGAPDGRVVYRWDKEIQAGNAVQCLDAACLDKWPPVYAASVTAGIGVTAKVGMITRPDGKTQAAIDGAPLYLMKIDEPGEANCQGAEGWWIVNPDGTKNTKAP